ncbi:MAG TPA: RNA-binding S4 domain-containing protein [Bryobacteraceae bacterium]|nr:RNA-binding S4 domain-containing protein [Bryobacteraceae bacterium]
MDKWLWAARFFKTRALAARACEMGRVQSGELDAKPAREVRIGDALRIRTDSGTYHIQVVGLSQMRGPAAVAQALYAETEESKEGRVREAEERKAMFAQEGLPEGRPSKRNRRDMNKLRGRF